MCDYFEKINQRIQISKSESLQTSELFTNKLVHSLQTYHNDIYGIIEPFFDNENQGLMINLYNKTTSDNLYIWSCLSDNKDLMIITSKEKTKDNLYMIDDIEKAQYFHKDSYEKAIEYSIEQIEKLLIKNVNINF